MLLNERFQYESIRHFLCKSGTPTPNPGHGAGHTPGNSALLSPLTLRVSVVSRALILTTPPERPLSLSATHFQLPTFELGDRRVYLSQAFPSLSRATDPVRGGGTRGSPLLGDPRALLPTSPRTAERAEGSAARGETGSSTERPIRTKPLRTRPNPASRCRGPLPGGDTPGKAPGSPPPPALGAGAADRGPLPPRGARPNGAPAFPPSRPPPARAP